MNFNLHILLPLQINTSINMVAFLNRQAHKLWFWDVANHSEPQTYLNGGTKPAYLALRGSQWYKDNILAAQSPCSARLLSQWDVAETVLHLMMKVCFNVFLGLLPCKDTLQRPPCFSHLQLEASPSDWHCWRDTEATLQPHLTQARTLTAAKNMNWK